MQWITLSNNFAIGLARPESTWQYIEIRFEGRTIGKDALPLLKRYRLNYTYTDRKEFETRTGVLVIKERRPEGYFVNEKPPESKRVRLKLTAFCAEYFGYVPVEWEEKYLKPPKNRETLRRIMGKERYNIIFPDYPIEKKGEDVGCMERNEKQ